MARKSLSSQVIEEVDRCRGLLGSIQDSSENLLGILIGTAVESLNRIESMCIAARQTAVNAVTDDTQGVEETVEVPAPVRRRSTSHKAPRGAKKAGV